MSEYFVIKREKCPYSDLACKGGRCAQCHGTFFIETRVDADEWLLERLGNLRWDNLSYHEGTLCVDKLHFAEK